jgi:hypothetical protein
MSDAHLDERDADLAFERMLLGSAQGDSVSEESTRAAWVRFAAASAGLAAAASVVPSAGWLSQIVESSRLKWLLAGGFGGALLAAGILQHGRLLQHGRQAVPAESRPAAAVSSAKVSATASSVAVARPLELGEKPAPVATAAPKPSRLRAQDSVRVAPVSSSIEGSGVAGSSTLAAEIAALDSIRLAISVGAYGQALRAVDKYHSDYPHGQLAPDADALAVEALREQGETGEAAARARRFLEHYPNDPHVDRVEVLSSETR